MGHLGVSWKDTKPVPLEKGFFVYCRELGRGDEEFRVGTAMMTDVAGDRQLDTLYIMIPLDAEKARQIEKVLLVVKSDERIVEVGIDKDSQDKIDRRK